MASTSRSDPLFPALTDAPQVHAGRRRAILERHPELRELAGPRRASALWIAGVVGLQLALATLVADLGLGWMLLVAYGVGAVASHALYVLIHECAHDLVLRSRTANKLMGIACDLALGLPSAIAFRTFHLLHHGHLGEVGMDPDIVAPREARLVGRSRWRKAIWLSLMSLSQALRPLKVPQHRSAPGWIAANVLAVIAVDALLWIALGPQAVGYLVASTLFALGPHPLGGRWIQEHYVTRPGQETYSYYGLGNKVAFNIGFHNEHHDFPNVAWSELPRVRRIAAEFYEGLASYRSWTRVALRFVLDPALGPYSRVLRADRGLASRAARTPVTIE